METTGQTGYKMTQKHLKTEHKAGIQEEGIDVETAGEDGSRQMRVETIHQWPLF